jgi:hypothetical protein
VVDVILLGGQDPYSPYAAPDEGCRSSDDDRGCASDSDSDSGCDDNDGDYSQDTGGCDGDVVDDDTGSACCAGDAHASTLAGAQPRGSRGHWGRVALWSLMWLGFSLWRLRSAGNSRSRRDQLP